MYTGVYYTSYTKLCCGSFGSWECALVTFSTVQGYTYILKIPLPQEGTFEGGIQEGGTEQREHVKTKGSKIKKKYMQAGKKR